MITSHHINQENLLYVSKLKQINFSFNPSLLTDF